MKLLQIRALKDGYQSNKISLYIKIGNAFAKPIEFEQVEEGSYVPPTLNLDNSVCYFASVA